MEISDYKAADWEYSSYWSAEENRLIEWYRNRITDSTYDSFSDKTEFNQIAKICS